MKANDCLLVLALSVPAFAAQAGPALADAAAPAASAGARTPRAGVRCPAASAPRARGAASSKLRHVPDEGDPCADSRGVARPVHPKASSPAP